MSMRMATFRTATLAVIGVMILGGRTVSLAAQNRPNPTSDPNVQAAERLFSAWIEGQIADRGLPGIVVGVVADQELVWAKGFGYANTETKQPMTPATKFRMASHSKLFTATAIMQLREQGKVRLDDPVADYLPWFAVKTAEPKPVAAVQDAAFDG